MSIVEPAIGRTAATPACDMEQFVMLVWTEPVKVEEAGPVSMRISCERAACGKGSAFVVIKTFGLPDVKTLVRKSESITVI